MAEPENTGAGEGPEPFMQQLLNNPFLLLFLGVLFPSVLYTIWGIIEVASIPVGQ